MVSFGSLTCATVAVQASEQKHSGAAYLSPSTKEPQQRERHHGPSYRKQDPDHDQPSTTQAASSVRKSDSKQISNGQHRSSPSVEKIQRDMTRHQYAQDNILQSYDLYIPELDASHLATDPTAQRYWVLYVHGGYFRDPAVTSASFVPALSMLVAASASRTAHDSKHSPFRHQDTPTQRTNGTSHDETDLSLSLASASAYISGYASINYRLAPHAQKAAQDRSTSTYELRNATWPEPLHDVVTAIAHLQAKYHFGTRYLLVGHSVGATMAALSTLASHPSFPSFISANPRCAKHTWPRIDPPMAVLGVAGIYDFPMLHASFGGYVALTRNAIPDPHDDVAASPARYTASEYRSSWAAGAQEGRAEGEGGRGRGREWKGKRALILAHSRDDGLVDWKQVEAMRDVFAADDDLIAEGRAEVGEGEANGEDGRESEKGREGENIGQDHDSRPAIDVRIIEITGAHNDIWSRGGELAKAIGQAVLTMRSLEAG